MNKIIILLFSFLPFILCAPDAIDTIKKIASNTGIDNLDTVILTSSKVVTESTVGVSHGYKIIPIYGQ